MSLRKFHYSQQAQIEALVHVELLNSNTEEEERVALMGLKVNLADQTVYPESFRMCLACLFLLSLLPHVAQSRSYLRCSRRYCLCTWSPRVSGFRV